MYAIFQQDRGISPHSKQFWAFLIYPVLTACYIFNLIKNRITTAQHIVSPQYSTTYHITTVQHKILYHHRTAQNIVSPQHSTTYHLITNNTIIPQRTTLNAFCHTVFSATNNARYP
jgi:hypothetical protein